MLSSIFSKSTIINARSISKDSKIYEAFKPYLFGILGLDLEEFMRNKELRLAYRQKFAIIKSKFQSDENNGKSLTDEDCFRRIFRYSQEWQEFVSTARENTLDAGESFIESVPLDSFILMNYNQKETLEQWLITAAIEKIRAYTQDKVNTSRTPKINMPIDNNNDLELAVPSRKM